MPRKVGASLPLLRFSASFSGAAGGPREDLRAENAENGLIVVAALRRSDLCETKLPLCWSVRARRGAIRM